VTDSDTTPPQHPAFNGAPRSGPRQELTGLEPPWAPELPWRLEQLVATGDLPEQRLLFADAEAFARRRGLGEVIDAWEPDLPFLRG
jgi:hypothetical protein